MKWKCKDGRVLTLQEMDTSHLQNAIAMLRRNGVVTPNEFFSCLAYSCAGSTPDGAAMAAEQEFYHMRPWDGLREMEAELDRRKRNGDPALFRRTAWFPSDIKPVWIGVYERQMPAHLGRFSYWNGRFWGGWGSSPAIAKRNQEKRSGFQTVAWRGVDSPCISAYPEGR